MDEEGSIQVIEALLAALIILTAVLFLTASTSPSPAEGQSGLDLAKVSQDTLRVLQQRPPADDIDPDADPASHARAYPSRLDEIVTEVLAGQDVADNEALVRELVPAGNRFQLRIDNGVDHLILLPTDADFTAQPRAAKAAETFVAPNWRANTAVGGLCDAEAMPPGTVYTPGGDAPFTIAAGDVLTAPNGETDLRGTTTWYDWWNEALTDDGLGTDKIPRASLYGWWHHADADGPDSCFFIGLPDGTATEYPTYGIQLVVWPIA